MSLNDLVYDRTHADVTGGTAKGRYNYTDLNRVEAACAELAALSTSIPADLKAEAEALGVAWNSAYDAGWDPVSLTVKTDWAAEDIPRTSDMERYLGNVEALSNAVTYRLPVDYTPVDYIESSGSQYIDTGFVPSSYELRVLLDFVILDSGAENYLGIFGAFGTRASIDIWTSYGNLDVEVGSTGISVPYSENVRNQLEITIHQTATRRWSFTATMNGSVWSGTTTGTPDKTKALYLFADNYEEGISMVDAMQVYSCRIYQDDVLVRDFVPCIHGGKAGMYDRAGSAFYTDAAGGAFIAGPKQGVLPDSMNNLDWQKANAIEAVLAAVDTEMQAEKDRISGVMEQTTQMWVRSGMSYAGIL